MHVTLAKVRTMQDSFPPSSSPFKLATSTFISSTSTSRRTVEHAGPSSNLKVRCSWHIIYQMTCLRPKSSRNATNEQSNIRERKGKSHDRRRSTVVINRLQAERLWTITIAISYHLSLRMHKIVDFENEQIATTRKEKKRKIETDVSGQCPSADNHLEGPTYHRHALTSPFTRPGS
jgi:hypothetical protein